MKTETARVVVREDGTGYKRPYSVTLGFGYGWLRTNGKNILKQNAIKTFKTRAAAQKAADQINAKNYVAPGISVQSATTELVSIGPAHPDYRG